MHCNLVTQGCMKGGCGSAPNVEQLLGLFLTADQVDGLDAAQLCHDDELASDGGAGRSLQQVLALWHLQRLQEAIRGHCGYSARLCQKLHSMPIASMASAVLAASGCLMPMLCSDLRYGNIGGSSVQCLRCMNGESCRLPQPTWVDEELRCRFIRYVVRHRDLR